MLQQKAVFDLIITQSKISKNDVVKDYAEQEAKGISDMIDESIGTFEMYEGLY